MSARGLNGLARFVPHAVVFTASMAIMIVELVASRLVSKYLGNSLFTWTSVIGIVLGGISLGNWAGGRLADRHEPRKLIPIILFVSSVLTVLIVVLDILVSKITGILGSGVMTMSILVRSILLITTLFFLPACALGTVSPVMAKFALDAQGRVGKTVGGIYAIGALGSIAGTFLTGYLLIPWLGLTANILLVGIVLALLALLMGSQRLVSGSWLLLLLVVAFTGLPESVARRVIDSPTSRLVYAKDSPYSYIQVTDKSGPDRVERTLRLDALIHNRYDASDRDNLLYDYEQMFASITREAATDLFQTDRFSTLTMGGGGFTFPSYLERHYPRSINQVVEIDPDVVETAHRYFDLPRSTKLKITIEDARNFVNAAAGKTRYDLVYCDAFNAFSVPYHLTTKEFSGEVSRLLTPHGLYVVNLIDIFGSGRFLNAYVNTMKAVFPFVSVYAPTASRPDARTTYVVVAGHGPFIADPLVDASGAIVASRLGDDRLASLYARDGAGLLTDDHAPVENLMAPVFLGSVE